jgi:uncharacterized protein (TIGR02996 family)
MSDEALDRLIEEWRSSRKAALADRIQELTVKEPESLAALWKQKSPSDAQKLYEQTIALEPDDPRQTVFFIKCLHKPLWPSSGGQKFWLMILDRLVALRDPRALAPLREALVDLPQFVGVAHSKWVVERLTIAIKELERACREANVEVPAETSEWLVRTKKGAAANTVEQVWANPEDDAMKLVVADALLEKNHPWGEFIALSMKVATTSSDELEKAEREKLEKRIQTLLNKHADVFGGPIAFIATKGLWTFEKGFLVSFAADRSQVPRRRWEDAVKCPHWATVREVALHGHAPQWWITEIPKNPATRNLRTLRSGSGDLLLERTEPGGAWHIKQSKVTTWATRPILESFVRGLPTGEKKRITVDDSIEGADRDVVNAALA